MRTCPTCRVPLGPTSLMRNIPMEKLAKTYFDRCGVSGQMTSSHVSQMTASHVSRVSRGSNDVSHHVLEASNHSSRYQNFSKT